MVQLCQNHWKTIDGNGGLKNINHSIALKNWPSLWSKPNQKSVNLQKFDVLISEDQLAVSDGKFWRLELMIPKNVHNQISYRD